MDLMNSAATTEGFAATTHSFSVHQQCGGLLQIARKEKTTAGKGFWKPECIIFIKEREKSKMDRYSNHCDLQNCSHKQFNSFTA